MPAPGHFNQHLRTLGAHSGAARCAAPGAARRTGGDGHGHLARPLVQRVVKLVCELLVLLLVHLGHGRDHPLHSRPVGRAEQDVSRQGQGSGLQPGWDRAGPGRRPLGPRADSQPTSDTARCSEPKVARPVPATPQVEGAARPPVGGQRAGCAARAQAAKPTVEREAGRQGRGRGGVCPAAAVAVGPGHRGPSPGGSSRGHRAVTAGRVVSSALRRGLRGARCRAKRTPGGLPSHGKPASCLGGAELSSGHRT